MTATDQPTTVDRIAIGEGSPEGTNSAYVVGDRAVVDPGPPADAAWDQLRAGLDALGVAIGGIEYVLVTHWHVDHAGLAPRLAEAASATVAMGSGDAPLVGNYASERDRRLDRDAETMRRLGVPAGVVDDVVAGDVRSAMPGHVHVERLDDGDTVAGIEAISTPGHTLGHTAFAIDDAVLVGDAVLPTYTPNVGGSDTRTLTPERSDGPVATGNPLEAARRTFDRLDTFPGRLLPGHGERIGPDRIDEIQRHHRKRSNRILAVLEERGAATPWDVAEALFGDMAEIHAKFGVGEAAAHLRSLERENRIDRVDTTPERYESS